MYIQRAHIRGASLSTSPLKGAYLQTCFKFVFTFHLKKLNLYWSRLAESGKDDVMSVFRVVRYLSNTQRPIPLMMC